jgi:hypothetical protein
LKNKFTVARCQRGVLYSGGNRLGNYLRLWYDGVGGISHGPVDRPAKRLR